jgi:hypothetical protein
MADQRVEGRPPPGLTARVDCTKRYELFECGFDAAAAETAVEESTYLLSGQAAVSGRVDGFEYAVGGGVAGGSAEEEGGACGAIVPHGEGGLQVRQPDDGAAVEKSVYGAEAQNLGFGPTGGGTVEARTSLAQGRVALMPERSCLVVAGEADGVRSADPIESAAEFGGDGR